MNKFLIRYSEAYPTDEGQMVTSGPYFRCEAPNIIHSINQLINAVSLNSRLECIEKIRIGEEWLG
jgi:hypothetical protein